MIFNFFKTGGPTTIKVFYYIGKIIDLGQRVLKKNK